MRILSSCATIVATLLLSVALAPFASAQAPAPAAGNPGANATRYGIAVVDVGYIFKKYPRFNALMEQMKADVTAAENLLKQERMSIGKEEEQLQSFQPGSPDFKRLDETLTKKKADFNVKATQQRKEFLEREARIYYQASLEVNDAIRYYAQQNNLGLVLRFNGDPIDPNNRQDVLRGINKSVVFQNGIDITPAVLQQLEARVSQLPESPRGAQIPGRPTRPN